jgi:hypothetical protein
MQVRQWPDRLSGAITVLVEGALRIAHTPRPSQANSVVSGERTDRAPLSGLGTISALARWTAHSFVRVAVRPVNLRALTTIVEIRCGGITERPSAGAAGQVDRGYHFSLKRLSNRLFQAGLDLLHRRPDKTLMKSRDVVDRINLLLHLVPYLRATAECRLALTDPMRSTMLSPYGLREVNEINLTLLMPHRLPRWDSWT